ncbi:MAG: DUF4956 domain-containing protein [Planctomycetota bacterium]
MDILQELFNDPSQARPEYGLNAMLLSLLTAFVLGQLIAWVYRRTHVGLSYSRSFTQSLVLINMVVATVMFVIGNSIVTAFGLIGALAIIRFRNVLKDTRDTVFVFFTLVLGMAIGSQRYLTATVGTLALLAAAVYLQYVAFGSCGMFHGHLSFRVEGNDLRSELFSPILERFCRRTSELSVRQGSGMTEYVFQVHLRDRTRGDEMIRALESLGGLGAVSLALQDGLSEV